MDLADVVIDNGSPPGDAAVELLPGINIDAISSLTDLHTLNCSPEEICQLVLGEKQNPRVPLGRPT